MTLRTDKASLPQGSGVRIFIRKVAARINTAWVRSTYPFARFGRNVSIDASCDFKRRRSRFMAVGDEVYLAQDVWLHVVEPQGPTKTRLIIGSGCRIGRRAMISAKNRIELEDDVLLGPNVLITDHNHEFSSIDMPIHAQGVTEGGRIVIGRNSWLGYGCVISCGKGELTLGRNCVVGANSVVLRSFPDYSVVAGNPARLIKIYDPAAGKWMQAPDELTESGGLSHFWPGAADVGQASNERIGRLIRN